MSNSKIRVLFIDDDGSIRIFAQVLFHSETFDIQVAANTHEADTLLKSHAFDVIVCDVMMPEEDGIKYCKRIRAAGEKAPFLFLSAVSTPDTVKLGMDAGANAYFIKPFDASELQRKIIELTRPAGQSKPSKQLPKDPKEGKKLTDWFRFSR